VTVIWWPFSGDHPLVTALWWQPVFSDDRPLVTVSGDHVVATIIWWPSSDDRPLVTLGQDDCRWRCKKPQCFSSVVSFQYWLSITFRTEHFFVYYQKAWNLQDLGIADIGRVWENFKYLLGHYSFTGTSYAVLMNVVNTLGTKIIFKFASFTVTGTDPVTVSCTKSLLVQERANYRIYRGRYHCRYWYHLVMPALRIYYLTRNSPVGRYQVPYLNTWKIGTYF